MGKGMKGRFSTPEKLRLLFTRRKQWLWCSIPESDLGDLCVPTVQILVFLFQHHGAVLHHCPRPDHRP